MCNKELQSLKFPNDLYKEIKLIKRIKIREINLHDLASGNR